MMSLPNIVLVHIYLCKSLPEGKPPFSYGFSYVFPWVPMGFHGFPWVSMVFCERLPEGRHSVIVFIY